MGSLGCITNSFGRIFWCTVFDYLSFKKILTILNFGLATCCILCIFCKDEVVYMIVVVTTYVFYGSLYGLMPTQTVRMCGD